MKQILSPRELADAIGVSESSIKRWADDGLIRATRTAGGHRRIPTREALRFVRSSRSPLVRPELLGLSDVESAQRAAPSAAGEDEQLFRFLADGAASEARGLMLSMYLEGTSVARIVDGPLRSAMERLGEIWHQQGEGIFLEHRATDIAIQSLNQLRTLMPEREGAPRAVGGAPSKDPYLIGSLAVATVLDSLGYESTNLGPETPLPTLLDAAGNLRPRLVWVSVTTVDEPTELRSELLRLLPRAAEAGIHLIVGGARHHELDLPDHPYLFQGSSMAELEAFAKGLTAAKPS